MARQSSVSADKFASINDSKGSMSPSELFELCAQDLELKSAVLDGLADGILVHVPDGALLYFNPAAARLYGYSPEAFAGLGEYGWVPPEVRPTVAERVDVLLSEERLDFQSIGFHADGTRIRTEVHSRVVDLPRIGRVFVSVIQDVTERLAAQEKIKHLAFHDTLTGLANRVMLDEQLRMAMASAERHGEVLGIVYLDLDAFKPVNDTYGHSAGDVVLKTVAERLTAHVREYDTVARMGGDEFLVLFPRLPDHEELRHLGRKLQECIEKTLHVGDHTVNISAKVGLATYRRGEAPDELVSRADHAMYRSRARGVTGWDSYGPDD